MDFFNNIKRRYKTAGGYGEFLKIAIPLVISTGIGAIELFTDRTFLSWYSQESFAASAPAGMSNWALVCFFFGTIVYVDVFVAQYYGKNDHRAIGPILWQGIYLSFISAVIILCISFFSESIFMNIGHGIAIGREEAVFFRTLCYGAFPTIAEGALAGFYVGRGKTKVVLFVSTCGVIVNVFLDYCLIFGNFHLPRMGIVGAAIATNISLTVVCMIYIFLIMTKRNNDSFNTRCMKLNFGFIKRLLRYGLPSGTEFFFDEVGTGVFMIIVGNLGMLNLAASNIAMTVYNVFFMPLVGCSITTSIMVGGYLGKNKVHLAKTSVRSSVTIVYMYIVIVALALIFFPNQFLYPFSGGAQVVAMEEMRPIIINLLRILAVSLIFDASDMIFSSAIKGAGDTLFVMKGVIFFSVFIIVIPTYFAVVKFDQKIYQAWGYFLLYSIAPAVCFYFRYKCNKWIKKRIYY